MLVTVNSQKSLHISEYQYSRIFENNPDHCKGYHHILEYLKIFENVSDFPEHSKELLELFRIIQQLAKLNRSFQNISYL